jgi:CubicO group peptidase (beta-lactamase class C family)
MNARGRSSKLVMLLSCFLFPFFSYSQVPNSHLSDDDWRTSTPEAQGVDSRKLLEMFRDIQAKGGNHLHSILVVRNGYLITESYLDPYHKDTLQNIKSSSKSILSALVGIALQKGYLKSLDQKVSDFYPEYVNDSGKKDITLRHLLTMTAGLAWSNDQELGGSISPFDLDAWKTVPMRDVPGKKYEYNTMLPHMMSAVLTKASGEGTKEFAESALFEPLGISLVRWSKDNKGFYMGGSEVFLRPRDMAKFGLLYLNKGSWHGQQVVPKVWIEESTFPRTGIGPDPCSGNPIRYGYWWWIPDRGFQARGVNGQYIFVRPDLNMVVVATGENQCVFFQYLAPYIFAAAVDKGPLPPNPRASNDLNRLLNQLENPPAKPIGRMPENAARVSGKKNALEPNKVGMQSLVLSFKDNRQCTMRVTMHQLPIEFPVGLNGNYVIASTGMSLGNNSAQDQIASKGSWIDDKTFAVKFHILGDAVTQTFTLKFAGDDVSVDFGNTFSATRIMGRMEK